MKGVFIPEITVEELRNASLEGVEQLMAEGTMRDIEIQDWIPCSELMPEEHEWIGTKKFGTTISAKVYVTFECPDGQRFVKDIMFQNGALSASDQITMNALYRGATPIAWKPLPEPYRKEANT